MEKNLLAQGLPWTKDVHYQETMGTKIAYLSGLEAIFSNVLGMVAGLAGLTCFIMLIIGGFKYLTASGDQKATAAAKATITWAIIGLVVLISSWFILRFLAEFTGVGEEILQFQVPTPAP